MEQFASIPATVGLILVNCAASFYAFSNNEFMEKNLFHVGPIVNRREWHRMITSGFLHGGVFHLLVNMYVLFNFGGILEPYLGTGKFLFIYMISLLGGNLWALMENRRNSLYRALDASGATAGIIMSFTLFLPMATLGFFFIPAPAVIWAIVLIVGSAILAQRPNKVIGHEAHLGGALAGILATIAVHPEALSRFSSEIVRVLSGG